MAESPSAQLPGASGPAHRHRDRRRQIPAPAPKKAPNSRPARNRSENRRHRPQLREEQRSGRNDSRHSTGELLFTACRHQKLALNEFNFAFPSDSQPPVPTLSPRQISPILTALPIIQAADPSSPRLFSPRPMAGAPLRVAIDPIPPAPIHEKEFPKVTSHLNAPHGGKLVNLQVSASRAKEIKEQSRDWPSWDLTPARSATSRCSATAASPPSPAL